MEQHRSWVVYVLRDETDDVLYVGMSSALGSRFLAHERTKDWWPLVGKAEFVHCLDQRSCRAKELELIHLYDPHWNRADAPHYERSPRPRRNGPLPSLDEIHPEPVAEISLGEMLRLARHRHRPPLTQEDVANFLGVEQPTVSRWESGRKWPRIHQLQRLSKYLNLDATEMVMAVPGRRPVVLTADLSAAARSHFPETGHRD